MNIQMKKVSDLCPYENNPRHNDDAVPYVANSIREFGFKVPIVIDSQGVIIAGHTRLKAAKKLRMREVPCIVADDLTEEQVKAFRLADNRVSEAAEWDFDLLREEMEAITEIDMEEFGFELLPDDEEPTTETAEESGGENERMRTDEAYNLAMLDADNVDGFYQIPIIECDHFIPKNIKSFNYALSCNEYDCGIHFFIDDYQFERVWNSPDKYMELLGQYECIFSPDFSLYMDMPMAMKIWNVYRSRLIGQYYQNCGLKVIPTISWAEKETFDFCFAGIPAGSIVAVSTIGVKKDAEAFDIWKNGMDEMMKRIRPKAVLVYGGQVEYDYGKTKVVYFDNENANRLRGDSE